jgi:hypothetical protein
MAKKRNTFGRFLPKGKKSKNELITVDNPKLAQFLAELSAGQSAVLTEYLLATEDVGGVEANVTSFEAGTPLEDIIRLMLQGTPTISINLVRIVDAALDIFPWNSILYPGDEETVGGVGFTYNDPLGEVTTVKVTHQLQTGPAEEFTQDADGNPFVQGSNTPIILDIVDFTIGGLTSTEPYVTYDPATPSSTSISALTIGFQLSMFDSENLPKGNLSTGEMHFAPPAFMINLNNNAVATAGDYTDFGAWTAQATLYSALPNVFSFAADRATYEIGIRARLDDPNWHPIKKHTRNGQYHGNQNEGYNQEGDPVTWSQPSSITTVLGTSNEGQYYDQDTPIKSLFFIPNGGGVANNVNNFILTQGSGTLTYSSYDDYYFDIGENGLGFAATTDEVLINYRVIYLDNDNNMPPGGNALTFNNP